MNSLEEAIKKTFDLSGSTAEANKAYLEFIKANFVVPVDKNSSDEEPEVLYLEEGSHIFLPVFTTKEHFESWAQEICEQVKVLILTGVDLLKSIGDGVTVSLNIGSPHYKEFNPAEIARMRSMVLKFWPNL